MTLIPRPILTRCTTLSPLSVFILRMVLCSALASVAIMGALGVRDGHQAKLPLAVICGLLGAAYFSRRTKID